MRVITWNVHRKNKESPVWQLLSELKPDIVLLQEVGSVPDRIKEEFEVMSKVAIYKTGRPQKFGTAILVKGKIIGEISLKSDYDWVDRELEFFKGNFVSCSVQPRNQEQLNVVSVYSPAWPVDKQRLGGIDVSPVKLKDNPKLWMTDLVWSALKNTISDNETWVIGGDYNSSETFDKAWQDKNRVKFGLRSFGNKEFLDRMREMGCTECLREYNHKIIPTFKHSKGTINHQMDHLFVTSRLYSRLETCKVGEQSVIFGESLSDHLPIIADFNEQ